MTKDKCDVVVVGGGVLGTFCAYHALSLGKTVALVERNKMPQEATVRNFGQIVPSGLSSEWRGFGRKSLEIYKSLQSIADFTVRDNGSIYLASCEDELTLLQEQRERDLQSDYTSELLSPAQTFDLLPGLNRAYCVGALRYPEEVSVDPGQMIHRVIKYLSEQRRLDYYPYTIVHTIETKNNGCSLMTNTGMEISGSEVIVCTGAEYQLLFPAEYRNDEISCVKIHMLCTEAQPSQRIMSNVLSGLSVRRYESFKECPSYAQIAAKNDQDPRIAEWGIHILFKQADNGEVIIGDAHHYADAHDKEDLGFDIEEQINAYILGLAKQIFDLETYQVKRTWTGIYSHAKHEPIIRKTMDRHIHILNAIGGKGMTAGPGYTYSFIQELFGA